MSASDQKEITKYFTESGECKDEIRLIFDDGNILYVSENFLSYASPVFKVMFTHEFIEKETREVKLPGKNYDQFLEFLLTLHPAVQKTVDNENVLDIAAIADEYQVSLIVKKCKTTMQNWLASEYEHIKSRAITDKDLRNRVSSCLLILHKSLQCKFDDITEDAIKKVCKFGYGVFTGKLKLKDANVTSINYYRSTQGIYRENYISEEEETADTQEAADTECQKLFSELPDDIKMSMLAERLMLCDRNTTL